jgi:hypothetical protein
MKSQQQQFRNNEWISFPSDINPHKCQLVLAFGAPEIITDENIYKHLKEQYPHADILMASTAGEIINGEVFDNTVVATAIELEKTENKVLMTNIKDHANSYEAGLYLYRQLNRADLNGIFVISDGTIVNGDELVDGLRAENKSNIPVTGGLAGDSTRFQKTYTGMNGTPAQGNIMAIGFYGSHFLIGHGSMGGWEEFGLERMITKSEHNVLQEIDKQNALDIYKKYLGEYAEGLPGSALLFPLSMKSKETDKVLIRTILAVDNNDKSMIFAGNVPEGNQVRLMRANFDNLIDASSTAARESLEVLNNRKPDLTLMVSCVGRKIILDSRTWEEVKNAEEVYGSGNMISGFYSYGGISPLRKGTCCELHNQTMTITTFTEI